ncbi:hypothetical protein EWF20_08655 [Sulfolobus sp. S-194]|uniref:hypothetical protein n=1 Tax=Sulfolobus sp. S-194 TaxID=2512240 RepID=UPI00143707EB|nr:hypothetical protein [Sulfolobus sp. S-194]QIW24207.1 hypothetical protein EWF20_08655 [Sulfolobus sp. S-194]
MIEKYVCAVCGRMFPQGQGVKITIKGTDYYFHSKACAYKFLREVVLSADPDCIFGVAKDVKRKYDDILEKKREASKKVI